MKKPVKIICIVLAAILLYVCYGSITPVSFQKCLEREFKDESILYESETLDFGKDKGRIVTSTDNGSHYQIAIVNCNEGLLNNKHKVITVYTFYAADMATVGEESKGISNVLNTFKDTDETGCYVGTVPLTCKSLTFNGVPATLIEQDVTVDGQDYSFYLYFTAANSSENVEITYINTDGENVPIEVEEF